MSTSRFSLWTKHRTTRWLLAASGAAALVVGSATPASAAGTFSATAIGATVSGSSVTVTATLTASVAQTVQRVSICARTATGANADFAASTYVPLSSTGTAITKTATLAPGTYRYWPCLLAGGVWTDVAAPRTFTVGSSTPAPVTSTPSSMPVGNLPGLTQVFSDNFSTTLARGSFPGPYSSKWMSYNGFADTSGAGSYDQSIISAQNGNLDLYLHTANGRPRVAAPVPLVNGRWGGQTYGRFSVRMKADAGLNGYGVAFLLWPDSGNWNEGEIDFPESGLTDVARGYNHCKGNPSQNCLVVGSTARYTDWHTYTIDWRPTKLTYLIDGVVVGSTTNNIPNTPMHWVMQGESKGPAASTAGHLLIDWATIYRYTP